MGSDNVVLLEEASQDLLDGRKYYDKRQEGLGDYFWQCLLSDLEALKIYSGVHIRVNDLYRMKSKRFPYAIYYEVNDNITYVIAVLPMKSKPALIIKSLIKRRT